MLRSSGKFVWFFVTFDRSMTREIVAEKRAVGITTIS
jgi:hypothetical protein